MRLRRAAVVLERAELRVGVDLIARRGEKAAAVVADEIETQRCDRTVDVRALPTGLHYRIADLNNAVAESATRIVHDRAAGQRQVSAKGAVRDQSCAFRVVNCAARRVPAD